MAIQTVTNANVGEFVAARQVKTGKIQTDAQMAEATAKVAAVKADDAKKDTKDGVTLTAGEETTSKAPKPTEGETTAQSQANVEKAKAGTDPALQKVIDRFTFEKKELEEAFEAEYNLRIEAERQLKAGKDAGTVEAIKVEELKRPRLADFKTPEEFDVAMDAYEAKQRDQIRAEAEGAARAQAAFERAQEELTRRYAQAEKDIGGDFREVIAAANAGKLAPPPYIQAALREGEYGVHVAYYLAKNPDELKRLEELSQVRAVAEIGKLEMRFAKGKEDPKPDAKTTTTVETTRAPEPLASVKADAGIVTTDLSKPMDFKDYRTQRLQEIRRKRH